MLALQIELESFIFKYYKRKNARTISLNYYIFNFLCAQLYLTMKLNNSNIKLKKKGKNSNYFLIFK